MKRIANARVVALLAMISIASRGAAASQYEGTYLYALPEDFGLFVYAMYSSGVFGGQVAGATSYVEGNKATIWSAPTGAPTNLHPAVFWYSQANGTDGIRQVGYGLPGNPGENQEHALVWEGTASSVVDIHPRDFFRSFAYDVSGNAQVGVGVLLPTFNSHALLWHGTAASAVDLHPVTLPVDTSSGAVSTDGVQQVGFAGLHAALWSGTAASFIDLHPASGYLNSMAFDVMNGQQVGRGEVDMPFFANPSHALLWTGSAESVIDLNPTNLGSWGYLSSAAYGTNGVQQVGWGQPFSSPTTFGGPRALLWNGTAASAVDLHSILPPGFDESRAFSIDVDGVIWGVAQDENYGWHAVMWTPVPEPTSLAAIAVGSVLLALRRGRIVPTADAVQYS